MKAVKLTLLLVGSAMYAQAQLQAMESNSLEKSDVQKESLRGKVKSVAVTGFTVVRKEGKLKKEGKYIHRQADLTTEATCWNIHRPKAMTRYRTIISTLRL